ncbi:XdhC protein (assists in molybdopterin insertion into xanthine dehydrogenase) [Rhodovulum sp. P5]|uniref:xanthine dehydrogenase accessory protein XdhC n=1 Tax=Rhodovulum sp. P5 TaxID=1564506 RepID=UPI0009C23089|nr:xanthine dehydrogenase accessory protein XdhC [Rhodovulum sp. P5]ARE41558.1 XdhC protein (assists in molybdopterin insertion into xanthine dehydrogenase) [Rhodovulum sp. P5]
MRSGEDVRRFLNRMAEVILVSVTDVQGSAPREAGSWMLVAADEVMGTVGGGQLEFRTIEAARGMLLRGEVTHRMDLPLGPGIGQCCGGRVEIGFRRLDAAGRVALLQRLDRAQATRPSVHIFGAGHVGRAVAACLSLLPVRTVVIDSRPEELKRVTPAVQTHLSVLPEEVIRNAGASGAYLILTHDHALDFMLAAEALARGDAAYVGMIGSATKRARFRHFLEDTRPDLSDGRLVCPVGAAGKGDKRPEVIAAFVAAELLSAMLPVVPPNAGIAETLDETAV